MCVSKHFLTQVNYDHCFHYLIVGLITLLLRVCVNLVQRNRYRILRRVCVRISRHFLSLVNCDHCSHCTIIAGSITLLPRVCVNLIQCYCYSIFRRVCVCLSKHFFTWVNSDHCDRPCNEIVGAVITLDPCPKMFRYADTHPFVFADKSAI